MSRGPALPTMNRTCAKHGNTPHRQNTNGEGVINGWKCIPCRAEYDAERSKQIKAGTWDPRWDLKKPEKVREQCPECFTELPATRICDCGYIPKEKTV